MNFAAMLLVIVSAFAQSGNNEPLKGDVNEDGVVDVADITAIIAIIKNNAAPQTTYYWYVGSTKPVSSSDVTSSGWTKLNSKPSQIDVNTDMVIPPVVWYVAIPHEYGFQPYESSGAVPDSGSWTKSQVTIQNVSYDVFTLNGSAPRVNAIYKV